MSLRDDKFEQELLKESEEGKKTIKRTIGKNTKEYRDMRRQSIKVTPNTTENFRKRQPSVFNPLKESQGNTLTNNNINTNSISNTNSNTQEKPQRPKGIVLPQAKKRTREIVGPYLLGDQLGRGQFGLVFRGVDSENGAIVAIKQLKSNQLSESSLQAFESEIELLKTLNHLNVVRYLNCIRTTDHVNLVIEYADGGSLTSMLKTFGKLPEKVCCVYIYQCLQGLVYLHSKDVVHRDIKGGNILLTKSGRVMLADFGISTTSASEAGPDSGAGFGSPYWMAPEVIEMEITPNEKADIWSLGCTVIELFTGNPPYHEYHPMGAIVKCVQDEHPPLPEGISKDLEDFLLKCFQKDIAKRASAKELLEHNWFKQVRESTAAEHLSRGESKSAQEKGPERAELRPRFSSGILGHSSSSGIGGGMSSGGTTSIKVYGETIADSDSPFKEVFLTNATTSEEVVEIVLIKYQSTEDPNHFAMFLSHSKTQESRQLDDADFPLLISGKLGKEESLYRFVVRPRVDMGYKKEGLLLKKQKKKFPWEKSSIPLRIVIDTEEKYIAYYRGDRPSSEKEEPVETVYNLRMLKDVFEENVNQENGLYEFGVIVSREKHVFRASSLEDMNMWIKMFKKAISEGQPLDGGLSAMLKSYRKARESKMIDSLDLFNRPRLTSSKSEIIGSH